MMQRNACSTNILVFYTAIFVAMIQNHDCLPNVDSAFPHFNGDNEDPNAVPPSPDDFAAVWGSPTFPPAVLSAESNAELMRSAPPTRMNAIVVMKHACMEALEVDELNPGDARVYASIVDPVSVLRLIDILENRISEEEIVALHQVIEEMSAYIRANALSEDVETLLLRAKQLVGLTS